MSINFSQPGGSPTDIPIASPTEESSAITNTPLSSSADSVQNSNGGVSAPTFNPATSSPAAPSPAGDKTGISPGVVAGAAVGAAVGAAILTFLITFMFLRRKNEKHHRRRKHASGSGGLSTYTEKALPKDPSHRDDALVAISKWQKHLPQSADDNTIRSSVKTLFDQVEVHVENFYRDSAVQVTESQQADLLRVDSPHLPESIVALLPRARSQTALIKHCLLSYIVASISVEDDSVQSLLPPDYATLPHLARAAGQKKPGKSLSTVPRPTPVINHQTRIRPSIIPMASPQRLSSPIPQERPHLPLPTRRPRHRRRDGLQRRLLPLGKQRLRRHHPPPKRRRDLQECRRSRHLDLLATIHVHVPVEHDAGSAQRWCYRCYARVFEGRG
jgi:hypothetical protein